MSEYLNKKAVLEYTKQNATIFFDLESYHDFRNAVLSGAFDADESEGTWKAIAEVLGRENAQLDSEIQRLRASLEMAQSELRWGDPANAIERVERIIDEALSTTSEPTNAAKVKRIECPCCGCEISINAPEGDGNDV